MKQSWHVVNFTDGVVVPAADGDQAYGMMTELARRHKDVISMFRAGDGVALFRPQEAERMKAQAAKSRLLLPASMAG